MQKLPTDNSINPILPRGYFCLTCTTSLETRASQETSSVRTSAQLCHGGQRGKEGSGLCQGKCVEQN